MLLLKLLPVVLFLFVTYSTATYPVFTASFEAILAQCDGRNNKYNIYVGYKTPQDTNLTQWYLAYRRESNFCSPAIISLQLPINSSVQYIIRLNDTPDPKADTSCSIETSNCFELQYKGKTKNESICPDTANTYATRIIRVSSLSDDETNPDCTMIDNELCSRMYDIEGTDVSVSLNEAPTTGSNNDNKVQIGFDIQMDNCTRPLPINSAPNPVLLSMITDQNETIHLAYYAPVANNNWTNFNSTNSSLNGIPVYSSDSPRVHVFNFRVTNSNQVKGILLIWTQYNYTTNTDTWSFGRTVTLKYQGNQTQNNSYYSINGNGSISSDWILMDGGDGSSPRWISVCFTRDNGTCPSFSLPINPASSFPQPSSTDAPDDTLTSSFISEMTTLFTDVISSTSLMSSFGSSPVGIASSFLNVSSSSGIVNDTFSLSPDISSSFDIFSSSSFNIFSSSAIFSSSPDIVITSSFPSITSDIPDIVSSSAILSSSSFDIFSSSVIFSSSPDIAITSSFPSITSDIPDIVSSFDIFSSLSFDIFDFSSSSNIFSSSLVDIFDFDSSSPDIFSSTPDILLPFTDSLILTHHSPKRTMVRTRSPDETSSNLPIPAEITIPDITSSFSTPLSNINSPLTTTSYRFTITSSSVPASSSLPSSSPFPTRPLHISSSLLTSSPLPASSSLLPFPISSSLPITSSLPVSSSMISFPFSTTFSLPTVTLLPSSDIKRTSLSGFSSSSSTLFIDSQLSLSSIPFSTQVSISSPVSSPYMSSLLLSSLSPILTSTFSVPTPTTGSSDPLSTSIVHISNIDTSEPFISTSTPATDPPDPSILISTSATSTSISTSILIISTSTSTAISTSTSTLIPISTSISSPEPSCTPIGVWPETQAGEIARGTCGGIFNATRHCRDNGTWGMINCSASESFDKISNEAMNNPAGALNSLNGTLSNISVNEAAVLLNLISTFLQNFTKAQAGTALGIVGGIFDAIRTDSQQEERNVGSQLVMTMDNITLKLQEPDVSISIGSIELRSQLLNDSDFDVVKGISSEANSISLPNEIFNTSTAPVRVASFIYKNMSSVLVPRDISLQLVSPVVSATTDCGECTTTGLTKPVSITFNISSSSYQMMISSNRYNTVCAFWDFDSLSEGSLPTGRWNSSGCNVTRIDGSSVECSCNHLTHFAILLSPNSDVSNLHRDILTTIGYVLVPISLICMLLTILTYSCTKKLYSLRNYIHVMLCINLFLSQVIFLFGIQRTQNIVACSVIAVVLQYMFLVTFMWMLMEGVVLYIALVKVFSTRTKRYGVLFTILSYGIPGVYMMIVVPIGYLVDTGNDQPNHYLYYDNEELVACWLSYETGFIWTFIAPVILIILINMGFFTMAIAIMRRHRKNQSSKNEYSNIKYWLKSSLSLTVVMGIAWVGSVLFFRKELLFIAYIMTVFIAAQGIIIFILYVLLSKQVRAAYSKWWKDKKANSQVLSIFTSKASFPLHSPNQTKDFKTHSNSNHYESSFNEKSDAALKSVASINEVSSPIATQEYSLVFENKESEENDS